MDGQEDREFNFSFDKKEQDGEYSKEFLEQKVDSLGWKVTIMSIIIPCLIGVVVILSYFSITKKVSDFQDTGSATVNQFSHIYEGKLEELRKHQKEVEDQVGRKLAGISQNAAAIEKNLNSIKSLTAADSKMSASIGSIQKDLEKLTEAVGEASKQVLMLRQQVQDAETRLTGLDKTMAGKSDTTAVQQKFDGFEKTLQETVDASTKVIKIQLKSVESRLSAIEQQKAAPSAGASPAPRAPVAESVPVAPEKPVIAEENL